MSEPSNVPASAWKRPAGFDHSAPLGPLLHEAIAAIFLKYDNLLMEEMATSIHSSVKEDESMSVQNQDSVNAHEDDFDDDDFDDDDDMCSAESYAGSPKPARGKCINLDDSDSGETMSITQSEHHYTQDHELADKAFWEPIKWSAKRGEDGDQSYGTLKSKSHEVCQRCRAYDTHCRSAAENYRRTLNNYTKAMSELMVGFKKVLERYPELKADCSDERVYYMVQAALGRNNLVREMVRLSAAGVARGFKVRDSCDASVTGQIAAVHEALNTCYDDGDAVRLILDRYADLYVQYVQVWREMCTKVSKDITVMELVSYTEGRPGVTHGEPWCEARAYIHRMVSRSRRLTPRLVADYCSDKLKDLECKLSRVPRDLSVHKEDVESVIDNVRERLDQESKRWTSDSHMSDLYLDIRSDLTVLHTLVGVGGLSVKTLLHERHLLVSQLRKLVRNQGSIELQLRDSRAQLREWNDKE